MFSYIITLNPMQTYSLGAFLYFHYVFNTLNNVCTFFLDIDPSFLSSQMCLCIINVNVHTAFYIQIGIFIRKNLLYLFRAPLMPALPFVKGPSLDPAASNPISQPFRSTSAIGSRLLDIPRMKHLLVKTTSTGWWGTSVKTWLFHIATWDRDVRWQLWDGARGAEVGKLRSSSLPAAVARTHATSVLSLEASPALTAEASWWKVDV